MKVGIIGAGMIGGTLGELWHAAGHEVCFSTRHPEALQALVRELGQGARAGSTEEATRDSDVVLLAVPLFAVPAVAKSIENGAKGKVVLDACNAYPSRDAEVAATAKSHPGGSSGWVASHLPGARVVKAFNTVYYKVLATQGRRGADDGIGIPLAGDDAQAVAVAKQLVQDAGFSPVVVGPLGEGRAFEPGTPVYNTGLPASEVARRLGIAR